MNQPTVWDGEIELLKKIARNQQSAGVGYGATGPTGAMGPTGPSGGPTGPTGPQGPTGPYQPKVVESVSTSPHAVSATNGAVVLFVDATSGTITITLPTAVGNTATIRVTKTDASTNAVVVDPADAELIEDAATASLVVQNESFDIESNGSAWRVF